MLRCTPIVLSPLEAESMNKKLCIISSHSPYGTTHVRDGIETLLVAASYDLPASLLLLGEGVLQLLDQQSPEALPQKNSAAMLQAAELYGVEAIYACREDLEHYGLTAADLQPQPTIIAKNEVAALLQNFNQTLNF